VRKGRLGFWLRLAGVVLKPPLNVFTRREWLGSEHVPDGAAILAVNHISYTDPLVIAHWVYDLPRRPRFLAKDSLFRVPFVKSVLNGTGQIPVFRGTRDASHALRAAREVLAQGHAVIIYPEGSTTKDPDLWPMLGKTGVARLALETGAPVIPVTQWGAQRLLDPRTPRKLRLRPRTRVIVVAGPPVDLSAYAGKPLTTEVLRGVTDTVMKAIRDQLAELRGEPAPTAFYTGPKGTDARGTQPEKEPSP
jgi:1-acyl-sn-glycerol-3-phosphate acyltransferase